MTQSSFFPSLLYLGILFNLVLTPPTNTISQRIRLGYSAKVGHDILLRSRTWLTVFSVCRLWSADVYKNQLRSQICSINLLLLTEHGRSHELSSRQMRKLIGNQQPVVDSSAVPSPWPLTCIQGIEEIQTPGIFQGLNMSVDITVPGFSGRSTQSSCHLHQCCQCPLTTETFLSSLLRDNAIPYSKQNDNFPFIIGLFSEFGAGNLNILSA